MVVTFPAHRHSPSPLVTTAPAPSQHADTVVSSGFTLPPLRRSGKLFTSLELAQKPTLLDARSCPGVMGSPARRWRLPALLIVEFASWPAPERARASRCSGDSSAC